MEVWQPRANRTCEQVWAEETPGGCSLGRVRSNETLGTDVVVRSLYEVLGNVERIVELWRNESIQILDSFYIDSLKLERSN